MRTIKFRQWRGKGKPFHYFEFKDGICQGVFSAALNFYPIDQFTGLCDINGKEIYENDIIKHTSRNSCNGILIKWDNGAFRLKYELSDIHTLDAIFDRYEAGESVVIGNIHENIELLER